MRTFAFFAVLLFADLAPACPPVVFSGGYGAAYSAPVTFAAPAVFAAPFVPTATVYGAAGLAAAPVCGSAGYGAAAFGGYGAGAGYGAGLGLGYGAGIGYGGGYGLGAGRFGYGAVGANRFVFRGRVGGFVGAPRVAVRSRVVIRRR